MSWIASSLIVELRDETTVEDTEAISTLADQIHSQSEVRTHQGRRVLSTEASGTVAVEEGMQTERGSYVSKAAGCRAMPGHHLEREARR